MERDREEVMIEGNKVLRPKKVLTTDHPIQEALAAILEAQRRQRALTLMPDFGPRRLA